MKRFRIQGYVCFQPDEETLHSTSGFGKLQYAEGVIDSGG